jgi:hypothetical protein
MPKRPPSGPSGPYVPLENAGNSRAAERINPFDPARLRLPQASPFGVREVLLQTSARVEKPNGKTFVRVNPDPAHQLTTLMIAAPGQRKTLHLLHPDVVPDLAADAQPYRLLTATDTEGQLFIWPCRWVALDDDGASTWHTSALEAANLAMTNWVRVISNMSISAYYTQTPEAKFPEPVWPKRPFAEFLEMAFRRNFIDSLDHPVAKKLRGAI